MRHVIDAVRRDVVLDTVALQHEVVTCVPNRDRTTLRVDVDERRIQRERRSEDPVTADDRQVIAQECEWEPDHDLRLVIENVALDPRPRLWLRPAMPMRKK